MNAVEIEEAVSKLVEVPFDASEFPNAFLEAFGNKTATLQRLRTVGVTSTKHRFRMDLGCPVVLYWSESEVKNEYSYYRSRST